MVLLFIVLGYWVVTVVIAMYTQLITACDKCGPTQINVGKYSEAHMAWQVMYELLIS